MKGWSHCLNGPQVTKFSFGKESGVLIGKLAYLQRKIWLNSKEKQLKIMFNSN